MPQAISRSWRVPALDALPATAGRPRTPPWRILPRWPWTCRAISSSPIRATADPPRGCSTGAITTVAGSGSRVSAAMATSHERQPNNPRRVALDGQGNLFISDSANFRVRRVDAATGNITTVAGNGQRGFAVTGAAPERQLRLPPRRGRGRTGQPFHRGREPRSSCGRCHGNHQHLRRK